MCDDSTEHEDVAREDVALRTIFLECLTSSPSSSSSQASLPTAATTVYASTLVDYIRDNASGKYRNKVRLDELQNAIEEVSVDGQVNWTLFKKASKRWLDKIRYSPWQDGNNNVENDDSKSDDEKGNSESTGGNNREFGSFNSRKPKTPRRLATADFVNRSNVSSYSPTSDTTHGCAMSTDTTPESADDTDSGSGICGEVAQVDLRLRVRRFDEENALLREELVRAEELSAGFQRQFEKLRRKLDETNDKCRQLERENDEHKEILHEVEQKERHCRWALQKVEKERDLISKQLEEAEIERQKITSLTSKLETYKKEKLVCVREAIVYRQEVEEKQIECEMLREKLAQITDTNKNLQESYEETIRRLREKNQELKNEIVELESKRSEESLIDRSCLTPPMSHLHCLLQSTPYSNTQSVQQQDSLYAELKASGFSVDDTANESRIQELEEELSWCNSEIRDAVKQIDNVLDQLNRQRRTPHFPDLPLNGSAIVRTTDIYELSEKISKLSNAVNEMIWKPKVKDASSQINVDSAVNAEKRIYSQYGITSFEDRLLLENENRERETDRIGEANERRESGFFVEAFSINSRLLGEYVKEVEVASEVDSYRETGAFSPSRKESMTAPLGIQEHTIIDPIVEELDRILQCTNESEEELLALAPNCSTARNPKFRGIYTCAQPTSEPRVTETNYSITDSTLNSPKHLEPNFAETYVITSGGDAPPFGMVNNNSLTNGHNPVNQTDSMLKISPCDDSSTFGVDSLSELVPKTQNLDISKLSESETLPEESFIKNLRDLKVNQENLSPLSPPSAESKTSKAVNDSTADKEHSTNANGITYSVTPNKCVNAREYPKRKVSVFQRSFDIDISQGVGAAGGPDTYRLTERSMSAPNTKQEKNVDDKMELDFDCMKNIPTRNFLLTNYRGNANSDSDSSASSSPEKSLGYRRDQSIDPPVTGKPVRSSTRPIVLEPKLKLPLLRNVACIKSVETKPENSSVGDEKKEETEVVMKKTGYDKCDADLTANENHKTYDVSEVGTSDVNVGKISAISEMIRPGDEVERGITYRRGSFSRELDFSSYSLLSPAENSTIDNIRDAKLESVSTFVPSADDEESTSCDSSPKRKPPVNLASRPLLSTYEKPRGGDQAYVLQDPSKFHDLRQVGCLTEGGVGGGYQTRNDSISSSVGNYGGGGGGGIRAPDGKDSVVPAVALAMSSGEDSSDSECDPMAIQGDEDRRNVVDETRSISPTVLPFVNGGFLGSSTPAIKSDSPDDRGDNGLRKPVAQKRDKREQRHTIRRSLSESGCGRTESSCHCTTGGSIPAEFNKEEAQTSAFPSLTNARLQESGIANLSSSDEVGGSLSEADLERKYTALSVGLVTDRLTLPRRMALSIRQRDQSERNLACEVQKMHQDIQDLAPLCIDRESLERVERVRHQLEMITQCAHRLTCTAETLGAVHQEHRISRGVLLADRYLLVLRTRCEKLASDLAETKRILTENNIVVEEHNGELGDDLPRIRYCGGSTNNRTMMARRRASIATIFRPLGNFQDLTKDGVRQRNSVSGRVTLRRPSLSAESQKWEAEKLDRTDSSSSIGELREIFEQAESRRNSREENNNVLRLHPSNLNIRDSENGEGDVWACTREEPITELPPTVNGCQESRTGRKIAQFWAMHINVPWKPMLWCILISFFLGFYMKHVVSSVNGCSKTPLRWWSIEELLEGYGVVKNDARRPI